MIFSCSLLIFQCCYQWFTPCAGAWSSSAQWLRTFVIGGSLCVSGTLEIRYVYLLPTLQALRHGYCAHVHCDNNVQTIYCAALIRSCHCCKSDVAPFRNRAVREVCVLKVRKVWVGKWEWGSVPTCRHLWMNGRGRRSKTSSRSSNRNKLYNISCILAVDSQHLCVFLRLASWLDVTWGRGNIDDSIFWFNDGDCDLMSVDLKLTLWHP